MGKQYSNQLKTGKIEHSFAQHIQNLNIYRNYNKIERYISGGGDRSELHPFWRNLTSLKSCLN